MSSDPSSPWAGWINAEAYDAFVRERPIYRWLNRHLVELARLGDARRVLDLACGTGATARACLRALPREGEVVGVDGSAAMVGVARSRVPDPRARFEVAAASEVARSVAGPFDRAVCNAALWQFPDRAAVLAAVASLLVPGGLFAFNVPASRLRGEVADVHPFQVALSHEVEERGAERATGDEVDPLRLDADLGEAGFRELERRRVVYEGRQGELMELMEIPAMLRRAAPDLRVEARESALAAARRRTDPDQAVEVPWVFWVARR